MNAPSIARGTAAVCAVPSTATASEPVADFGIVLVLSGMRRFPSVMRMVRRLGDELFPRGAYRYAATALVRGSPPDGFWLTARDRALLSVIRQEVQRTTIPDTEEWGIRLVQIQAERQFQPLLASALRWAAERVEQGVSLAYVRRVVGHCFDIAEGNVPLDPSSLWEPTP